MSKKHVDKYFQKICEDYHELVNTLSEMGELLEQNIISPEKYDEIKNMVEQMKVNYMRISYIMYLLNKPNKKQKQKKYEKIFPAPKEGNYEEIHNEDLRCMENLKNII